MSIAPETHSPQSTDMLPPPRSRRGEWTWELVTQFPQQGEWSENEYLSREFEGLVEYSDGVLEFLPTPTWLHQLIVDFLHSRLKEFVQARHLGRTAFAPWRVRVGQRQYREPDVLFIKPERFRGLDQPTDGANLVMEVVSGSKEDRERDLITKRTEYAVAGIPEYWIVDPVLGSISVLTLNENHYQQHGEFHSGFATSVLLSGFQIDVKACFSVGQNEKS